MKNLIKQVALDVARTSQFNDIGEATLMGFAEAFLAELSKRADAVAWMQISVEEGVDTKVPRSNKPGKFNPEWWKFEPLFTFPPINSIEAIENRVAEACAKACIKEAVQIVIDGPEERAYNNATSDCAEAIKSGEWRKYK